MTTTATQLHEALQAASPRATERRFRHSDCEQFVEQTNEFRRRLNLLLSHVSCPEALDTSISLTAGAVPNSYRWPAKTDVLSWWGRFSAERRTAQHMSGGEGEVLRMTIMYTNPLFSGFKARVKKLAEETFDWYLIIHWQDGK
jgi:hypothetical protein